MDTLVAVHIIDPNTREVVDTFHILVSSSAEAAQKVQAHIAQKEHKDYVVILVPITRVQTSNVIVPESIAPYAPATSNH